jgi:hypothetical protein
VKPFLFDVLPWVVITIFILSMIETYFLIKEGGNTRRGFIIWKRTLSNIEYKYLSDLKENVVVYIPVLLSRKPVKQGFIIVEDQKILIQFRTPQWRTGWPYVGFVDLSKMEPSLEYRAAFLMHIIPIGLFLLFSIVDISKSWMVGLFLIGMFYLNFSIETKAIDNFLLRQIETY